MGALARRVRAARHVHRRLPPGADGSRARTRVPDLPRVVRRAVRDERLAAPAAVRRGPAPDRRGAAARPPVPGGDGRGQPGRARAHRPRVVVLGGGLLGRADRRHGDAVRHDGDRRGRRRSRPTGTSATARPRTAPGWAPRRRPGRRSPTPSRCAAGPRTGCGRSSGSRCGGASTPGRGRRSIRCCGPRSSTTPWWRRAPPSSPTADGTTGPSPVGIRIPTGNLVRCRVSTGPTRSVASQTSSTSSSSAAASPARASPSTPRRGACAPRSSSATTSPRARRRSRRSSCTAACATSSRARSASSTRRSPSASVLRSNAPHLVRVLPFLLPVFTRDGAHHPKLARALGSAMWMYDLTGGARIGKLHKRIDKDEALAHMPTLRGRQLAAVVPLLRRPGRRRPPHAHPRPHRGRPRRGRGQPRAASSASTRTPTGASTAPRVRRRRRGRSRSAAEHGRERDRRVVRRRARARRGHAPATRSARPRASTSPCRGRWSATTSPRSSRCRRTSARCSSCRGATSPTSAPPTPTTTARSTTRSARPRTSRTCSRDQRRGHRRRSPRPTSLGTWAGLRPLVTGGAAARRTADLSRRHSVRRVGERRGHGHRRQAHDLPAHGRRHRRRGRCTALGRRRRSSRTKRLHAARRAQDWDAAATRRRAPRRPLRRRRPRRARASTTTTRRWPSRSCPASPTRGPRSSTRSATRWPARSTTCCPAAPAPGSWRATRRPRPPPDVAALIAAELGWDDAEQRPRRSTRYRALVEHERTAAGLPETALDALDAGRLDRPTSRPPRRTAVRSEAGRPDADDRHRRPGRRRRRSRSRGGGRRRRAARRHARRGRRRRCSRALAATGAEVRSTPRRDRRGEPRLVAARDDLGARRPGRRARGRGRRPARRRRRGRRGARASCNEARRPGHRRRRAAAACAARACPCYGGVVLDLTAIERHRRRRPRRRWSSTCCPARSATCSRTSCAPSTASPCGHWPQSMALSTVGGWLACRGAGQLRPATARSRTSSSASTSCSPTARSITTGGARPRRGRPRPHPAVRRLRGHARHHHRRPAARCTRCRRPTGGAAYAFASFADGLDACAASSSAARTPAVLRLYDAIEADRSYQTGDDARAARARRGRRRRSSTRRIAHRRRGVHATPSSLDVGLVEQWLEHRNDVSALEALISRGLRRRHDGDRRRRGARCPTIYERGDRGDPRGRAHAGRVGAPVATRTPTARCLYFTFAGQPPRRPTASRTTAPRGTPGTRAVLAARRRAQPPPRRRAQPGPLRAPTRSAPAFDVLAAVEAGARPERHPQPGQARPARPVRRPLAVWPDDRD